ncbi:MAG: flagellar hook-length control protein FliK [Thermoguttaceae bacterium]
MTPLNVENLGSLLALDAMAPPAGSAPRGTSPHGFGEHLWRAERAVQPPTQADDRPPGSYAAAGHPPGKEDLQQATGSPGPCDPSGWQAATDPAEDRPPGEPQPGQSSEETAPGQQTDDPGRPGDQQAGSASGPTAGTQAAASDPPAPVKPDKDTYPQDHPAQPLGDKQRTPPAGKPVSQHHAPEAEDPAAQNSQSAVGAQADKQPKQASGLLAADEVQSPADGQSGADKAEREKAEPSGGPPGKEDSALQEALIAAAANQPALLASQPGHDCGTAAEQLAAQPIEALAARRSGPASRRTVPRVSAKGQPEPQGVPAESEQQAGAFKPTGSDDARSAGVSAEGIERANLLSRTAQARPRAEIERRPEPNSPGPTGALRRDQAAPPAPEAAEPAPGTHQADRVRFVQRVARAFQAAAERGGTVRLRLHPPELGSVRVELTLRNGKMLARLETETETARSLIVENLPLLRQRLAEHQIHVERFDVDLGGGSSGSMAQQPQEQFGQPPGRAGHLLPPGRNRNVPPAAQASQPAGTRPGRASRFDVII